MDLLIQLGVNQTLGIQMVTFLIAFLVLKYFLFEPYYAAFNERTERTLGKTELAERFIAESRELEEKYAVRAQEANDRFREVYDKSRVEAVREHDRLVSEAREKTKGLLDEMNKKIQKDMASARTQLSQETTGVSELINQKMIGKEMSS
jgi:F0F1-type ATP synthase membrane subunit b/b'